MSLLGAKEMIRRSVRLWGPVCQQLNLLAVTPSQSQKLAIIPRQNQTPAAWCLVSSAKFYSQQGNITDERDDKGESLPAELKEENTVAGQALSTYLKRLEPCGSPSDVLDLICQYSPTSSQISHSLMKMWVLTKKMSEDQRRYELHVMFEHPAFDKLLQQATELISLMPKRDLVYALLSMVKLGVPQQSRVIQTSLRTVQERLNDLDERCLSILATCLESMEDCPNVVALKAGMRLVFKERLWSIGRVATLQTLMRLLGKDATKEFKWKLEKKVLSMTDQFTLPNSCYMIATMVTMDFYSKPLLEVCNRKIEENLHGIPFAHLLRLLLTYRELRYKDTKLLATISAYVTSMMSMWTNKQLLLLMSAFEKMLFCPSDIMAAYAEKVIANPDLLTLTDLLCILKVYSSLNYGLQHQREPFLDSLSRALDSYLHKMSAFALLKAVYYFCLLGHFPPAALDKFLQSSSLQQHTGAASSVRERMLHTVGLCLRLDRPPLPRPHTFPTSATEVPVTSESALAPWLLESLRSLLGGQEHVTLQGKVVEENFYLIDAVITQPGAGEHSSPAGGSRRTAVILASPSCFCLGTANPRGPLALKVRHLKILGYEPVLVPQKELQSVPGDQRTDLLRTWIFPEQPRSERRAEAQHSGP